MEMKRRDLIVMGALLLAAVSISFAGGKDKYKCTHATQDCLNSMSADAKKAGWIGVELDHTEAGEMVVKRVIPGSPAEAAGLKIGDAFISLNTLKYGEQSAENKAAWMALNVPGKEVTLTIKRGGYEKKIAVTLGTRPAEVIAQQIGMHMLDHAQDTAIAKN